ncbi:MAG TPA: D-alanyl-D-alanine carboxypeptidase family protein [Usitatibacter sp.]|nr:D-alanyl-D-alanine carboxypeptidase family protein [Usitatibacter sp.]
MKRLALAWVLFTLSLGAAAQMLTPPPIAARAYFLVDLLSGTTLAAANDTDRVEPASLTKLMTSYLVFDAIRSGKLDPAGTITVSPAAAKAPGARMFLEAGKTAKVAEVINGMVVQSGNDAAIALAEAVAGSQEAFVALMNREAERLHLNGTHFVNPTGEPAAGHYSTARDLSILAASLIRDFPDRYALYSQREFSFNHITQANRNRLLWTDPTVDGMKTGFTEAAGYCLVASAKRGPRRLLSVVLGAPSDGLRTSESQKLLNFGFQAYETRLLYRKGAAVGSSGVFRGTQSRVSLGFDHDIWLTLPRERFTGLEAQLETRQPFIAPLAAGQKAGIMKLTRDNAPIAEFPVVALEDVPVGGFLSRGWDSLRLLFARSS